MKRSIFISFITAILSCFFVPAALAQCGPVVLDAGHGGWDSGAVGPTGFQEKTANLDIALRTKSLLERAGYTVVMTRTTDVSPNTPPTDLTGDGSVNVSDDLQARVNIANHAGGKIFVSFHNNASMAAGAHGTETYFWSGNSPDSDSARLARLLQEEIIGEIGLSNRGVKGANFYVLKRTDMPAALIEGAFISNPAEEALLKSPSFRQKVAIGVYNGIRRYASPSAAGDRDVVRRTIKPGRRAHINVSRYLCNKSFGAKVISDVPVISERSMYFSFGNKTGGSNVRGATRPAFVWFFAEGKTGPDFDTWILLTNPTEYSTIAKLRFMNAAGVTVVKRVTLAPRSRRAYNAAAAIANGSFGIRVSAGRRIVAERSMYFKYGDRSGGSTVVGMTAAAKKSHFAEGSTEKNYDTWILLLNPRKQAARARIQYMTTSGVAGSRFVTVPPRTRRSIMASKTVSGSEFSFIVTSDNPLVVERSVFFNYDGIKGGSTSSGTRFPSRRWRFAQGNTRRAYTSFLSLLNPMTTEATVVVKYFFTDGTAKNRRVKVAPRSRVTVDLGKAHQAGKDKRFAMRVLSDQPIVAERTMYHKIYGYLGGHVSMGSINQSKRWYFSEGHTGDGFEPWIIISNQTKRTARVKVRLFR